MKSVNHLMLKSYSKLHSLDLDRQKGATTVEYGLIVAIVVAMVIGASAAMEGPLNTFFTQAVTKITTFMGT